MTPFDLFSMLREILAEECGCKVCWGQHPHPLSADELTAIQSRVLQILNARSPQVLQIVNQDRRENS
jgi:hypothetical protein